MGVYQWKDKVFSTSIRNANPQKVGIELESLPIADPKSIVDFARSRKKSELHKCFTWDDDKAAELWRMEEARTIVQSIIVVEDRDEPESEPITYRAFESVKIGGQRRYMKTTTCLHDDDLRAQVFGEISNSIGELSQKAKTYRYLAESEIDKLQMHLDLAKEAVTL